MSEAETHQQRGAAHARLPQVIWAVFCRPSVLFLLLALAVMGPLLAPGHVFALDSPLSLNWDLSGYFWGTSDGPEGVYAATYNSAPVAALLKALSYILPDWVVEKAWLVLLLWLCGVGAFRLPYLRGLGRYYAGVFYMVNPFTYVRFISGQWGVLGAYAVAPFIVAAFVSLLDDPRPRRAVLLALLLTASAFLQVHGLVLVLVVLLALLVARLFYDGAMLKRAAAALLLGACLFLGVNAFWIARYVLAGGGVVANMTVQELSYFAASPPLHTLALQGFWLSKAYVSIGDLIPAWLLLFVPLLLAAAYGAVLSMEQRRTRWLGLGLLVVAGVGLVFAAGPGLVATRPVFELLWEWVPAYRVFRDSHKFVALLALAYSYLDAFTVQWAWERARQRWPRDVRPSWLVAGIALLLPLLYGLPMLGVWGQLRPTQYPSDWGEVRERLDADRSLYNVLVMPWYMYQDFDWVPNRWKRVGNLGLVAFSQPTLSGDNLEIGFTRSESQNLVSRYVETLLEHQDTIREFGRLIAPLNAKYVVCFKGTIPDAYDFLRAQEDMELVHDGATIALFRNRSPTTLAYAVEDRAELDSLQRVVASPAGQTLLARLFDLRESGLYESEQDGAFGGRAEGQAVTIERGPASYRFSGAEGRYLVLTLPQRVTREGWSYDGSEAMLNLGMMPAFELKGASGTVAFTPFWRLHLPLYLVAAAAVACGVVVWWRCR